MDISYERIINDLSNKKYSPVYFLFGDEPYYIDLISNHIQEHVLTDEEKTFNQTVIYGKDADALAIINAAKRFPMMSNYQVVIVKEAQELKDIDLLLHYIEQPLKSTLLVLNYKYKKPDKRKKVFKSLQKHSVFFESKKLYDEKVPGWISAYLSERNRGVEPKAAMMLVEFLGSDLSKIANELDKLILVLDPEEKTINSSHVERNIGISKDFNSFELQKALGSRNVLKANQIINYFAENQKNHPLVLTISTLHSFFSKLLIFHWLKDKSRENVAASLGVKPFFVGDYFQAAKRYNPNQLIRIIGILREYDLKSKGYKGATYSPGELLKEMIYKILH